MFEDIAKVLVQLDYAVYVLSRSKENMPPALLKVADDLQEAAQALTTFVENTEDF